MPPAQTPEQRAAAAAAKANAKVADADFTELYRIIMKEKNTGFDSAAAIIVDGEIVWAGYVPPAIESITTAVADG